MRARSSSATPAASRRSRRSAWAALGAHRPDVGRLGAQREREDLVVDLGVVREHGKVGRAIDPPELLERVLWPLHDHLVRVAGTAHGGELFARVDHVGPPTGHARQVREMARVLDGAEDEHARRRRGDVDEQLAPQLRALRPHQLVGVGDALRVERGVPERPLAVPVGAHEQPLAGVRPAHRGDERRPLVRLRRLRERALRAHGS